VSDKTDGDKAYDPFEAWRGMRDANLESWSKMMIEGVNSEAYAKMSGAMLDSYLTASGPFREMLEKTMVRALEQLSMPSRADFAGLAQRLTNLERRLDDLDAKLDRIEAGRDAAPKQTKDRKES
jgi:polyhydroxyalkanoic acid synthase PhaR subunit